MILADDEKKELAKEYIEKIFEGKEPSDAPELSFIVGGQGSGKSTLAKKSDNSVIISGDDVVLYYAKQTDQDIREVFLDDELKQFAGEVNSEMLKKAVSEDYNVIYETSGIENVSEFVKKMLNLEVKLNHSIKVKAVLNDEYSSALNVEERNLARIEKMTAHRQGKLPFPDINPLTVRAEKSVIDLQRVLDALGEIDKTGLEIEVYEFGKNEPSYVKGKTHKSLENFLSEVELPDMKQNIDRSEELKKKAKECGDEDAFLRLNALQKEMKRY